MTDVQKKTEQQIGSADSNDEGRRDLFMDIDRMVSEGLGGGQVTMQNGLIEDTTTDTMLQEESVLEEVETGEAGET